MEKRDGIGDFNGVVGGGDAADQDAVDGGCRVFERVKNEFDVCVLWNLVLQIVTSHVSDNSDDDDSVLQHTTQSHEGFSVLMFVFVFVDYDVGLLLVKCELVITNDIVLVL